jgi:hypothetical protein
MYAWGEDLDAVPPRVKSRMRWEGELAFDFSRATRRLQRNLSSEARYGLMLGAGHVPVVVALHNVCLRRRD